MAKRFWRVGFLVVIAGVTLAACGPEDSTSPASAAGAGGASQGAPVSSTPTTENSSSSTSTSTPPPPATANQPPVISGSAATSVQADTPYSFTPTASDPNGDALSFSITGKPSWASFSTATGALTGTPTAAQAGTYASVVIAVSDGRSSQVLPAFTITVAAVPAASTTMLSWTPPTQNLDGTELTDLAGYRIYHGTSEASLDDVHTVAGADSTNYAFASLASGTHYFAITAYTASGAESPLSPVLSKVTP